MKKKLGLLAILVFVMISIFMITSCSDGSGGGGGGGSGGGGGDVWSKLSSGTGKWVMDSDPSIYIIFKPVTLSGGGMKEYAYEINFGGGKTTGDDWWIENNGDIGISGGKRMKVTFHSNTKITIAVSEDYWIKNLSGDYTKQ